MFALASNRLLVKNALSKDCVGSRRTISTPSKPLQGCRFTKNRHSSLRVKANLSNLKTSSPTGAQTSDDSPEPSGLSGRVGNTQWETLLGVGSTFGAALLASYLLWVPGPCLAYTPPPPPAKFQEELVQVTETGDTEAVLDYAKMLSPSSKATLAADLKQLEESTGWKIRLVTGYGPGSAPSTSQLQKYWKVDAKTIIVSFDEAKGNVLEFYYDSVNPEVKATIPKNVFQELRGRYGNVYFLREEGSEAAVLTVSGVLTDCLNQGGCKFVPGLSEQQRQFSLIAITSGGFLSGAVLRNKFTKWTWLFLFIWGPWIGLFGFYPLYIRQPDDLTPLFGNLAIFAVCFGLTALTPLIGEVSLPKFLQNNPDPNSKEPSENNSPEENEADASSSMKGGSDKNDDKQ